ncbi:MAG: hypothetical protein QXX17_08130 [Conexivisphaerales archaeon]
MPKQIHQKIQKIDINSKSETLLSEQIDRIFKELNITDIEGL